MTTPYNFLTMTQYRLTLVKSIKWHENSFKSARSCHTYVNILTANQKGTLDSINKWLCAQICTSSNIFTGSANTTICLFLTGCNFVEA